MRRMLKFRCDAVSTQGALRRMRRIRQGVVGGERAHRHTCEMGLQKETDR